MIFAMMYYLASVGVVGAGAYGIYYLFDEEGAKDFMARATWYSMKTYVQLNEQVTLQNQDPVLNECAARLGVSLRQTEDQLTRDMLAATAGFINCTGGVNGDNPTEITRADVDVVVRSLLNNNG